MVYYKVDYLSAGGTFGYTKHPRKIQYNLHQPLMARVDLPCILTGEDRDSQLYTKGDWLIYHQGIGQPTAQTLLYLNIAAEPDPIDRPWMPPELLLQWPLLRRLSKGGPAPLTLTMAEASESPLTPMIFTCMDQEKVLAKARHCHVIEQMLVGTDLICGHLMVTTPTKVLTQFYCFFPLDDRPAHPTTWAYVTLYDMTKHSISMMAFADWIFALSGREPGDSLHRYFIKMLQEGIL